MAEAPKTKGGCRFRLSGSAALSWQSEKDAAAKAVGGRICRLIRVMPESKIPCPPVKTTLFEYRFRRRMEQFSAPPGYQSKYTPHQEQRSASGW